MKPTIEKKLLEIRMKKAKEKYLKYCDKMKLTPAKNIKFHFSTELEKEIFVIDVENQEVICSLESF